MIGDCSLCEINDICEYIYAEYCPYIIEEEE